jgi:hypothetical protein
MHASATRASRCRPPLSSEPSQVHGMQQEAHNHVNSTAASTSATASVAPNHEDRAHPKIGEAYLDQIHTHAANIQPTGQLCSSFRHLCACIIYLYSHTHTHTHTCIHTYTHTHTHTHTHMYSTRVFMNVSMEDRYMC